MLLPGAVRAVGGLWLSCSSLLQSVLSLQSVWSRVCCPRVLNGSDPVSDTRDASAVESWLSARVNCRYKLNTNTNHDSITCFIYQGQPVDDYSVLLNKCLCIVFKSLTQDTQDGRP